MSKKILIAGSGRSGTTFLMQLLTRVGLDTGFVPYQEPICLETRAGCEYPFKMEGDADQVRKEFEGYPKVVKSPGISFLITVMLDHKLLELEHMLIPVRRLKDSAESRASVGLFWGVAENSKDVVSQQDVHAMAIGQTIEACVMHDVPHTLIHFPRFIQSHTYCYNCLKNLKDFKISKVKFKKIFDELNFQWHYNFFKGKGKRYGKTKNKHKETFKLKERHLS
jgi:hypothetical protein